MNIYELDSALLKIRKEYNDTVELLQKEAVEDNGVRLQVRKHRKSYQYFLKAPGEPPKYIKKTDPRVSELIQQKYNLKIITLLKKKIRAIDDFRIVMAPTNLEKEFDDLTDGRKNMVTPSFMNSEMFAQNWAAEEYEKKPVYDDPFVQTTMRGEKVRSKSEVFIANELFRYEIPYKYEKPLKIGGVIYHPDFTVINKRTRRTYYWEHLGMIDDPAYIEDALRRLLAFRSVGLSLGKDVIITAESQKTPLNTKTVDSIISEYLK